MQNRSRPKNPQLVTTLDIIEMAQQGVDAANSLVRTDPARSERIKNMSETLLSAGAIVLRYSQANIPAEAYDTMYALARELASLNKKR